MRVEYLALKNSIYHISKRMLPQICADMDDSKDKKTNYYFSLVNEIYKGLALCCVAMDMQAYSQVGTLLRQLIEQVATAKVIGENEDALRAYVTFAKAKIYYLSHDADDKELKEKELKELLNKSQLKKKPRLMDYYTLGWLEYIGENNISYERLLEVAQIEDLQSWRLHFDNFVHTNLTFMNFTPNGMIKQIKEFVYILAILFDIICCSYHQVTSFDFEFDGKCGFEEFRNIYKRITEYRKNGED